MPEVLLLIPFAYLLGTLPSARLVTRRRGIDVHNEGSGNPGASNVFRLMGWKWGLLVLALDIGKGALAAGVGAVVDTAFDGHRGAYVLGLAAVLGHVFPITRHLKGGRGVATGAGALAVPFPLVMLVTGVVWVLIARGLHKASVASVACAVMFTVIVVARGASWLDMSVVSVIAGIIIVRHLKSLWRVVRGRELGLSTHDGHPAQPDSTSGAVDDGR
ncbi:MAG: glycerol-3-phosphate acyltransferase [Acidimicrobiia bacterium]